MLPLRRLYDNAVKARLNKTSVVLKTADRATRNAPRRPFASGGSHNSCRISTLVVYAPPNNRLIVLEPVVNPSSVPTSTDTRLNSETALPQLATVWALRYVSATSGYPLLVWLGVGGPIILLVGTIVKRVYRAARAWWTETKGFRFQAVGFQVLTAWCTLLSPDRCKLYLRFNAITALFYPQWCFQVLENTFFLGNAVIGSAVITAGGLWTRRIWLFTTPIVFFSLYYRKAKGWIILPDWCQSPALCNGDADVASTATTTPSIPIDTASTNEPVRPLPGGRTFAGLSQALRTDLGTSYPTTLTWLEQNVDPRMVDLFLTVGSVTALRRGAKSGLVFVEEARVVVSKLRVPVQNGMGIARRIWHGASSGSVVDDVVGKRPTSKPRSFFTRSKASFRGMGETNLAEASRLPEAGQSTSELGRRKAAYYEKKTRLPTAARHIRRS